MKPYDNPALCSLDPKGARLLSHSTKSVPMMEEITPRWLLKLLPWVPVESGVYRLNKLKKCTDSSERSRGFVNEPPYEPPSNDYDEKTIKLSSCQRGEAELPQTYPDYDEKPREFELNLIQTILNVHTRVSDIYNVPHNQLQEQLRLTTEAMQEQQELEIINNRNFGLLHSVAPAMRINPRKGSPSPDDLDELLALVWKKPAFFLAHPKTIAAFGRECTRLGVPPVSVTFMGSPFITWRGVPLIPCDKLFIGGKAKNHPLGGTTSILLMRIGENEQGIIGLHQPGIPDEYRPGLSLKFAGINDKSIAQYVLSLYFSVAILTDDALGMLENVEVDNYYDYD